VNKCILSWCWLTAFTVFSSYQLAAPSAVGAFVSERVVDSVLVALETCPWTVDDAQGLILDANFEWEPKSWQVFDRSLQKKPDLVI